MKEKRVLLIVVVFVFKADTWGIKLMVVYAEKQFSGLSVFGRKKISL